MAGFWGGERGEQGWEGEGGKGVGKKTFHASILENTCKNYLYRHKDKSVQMAECWYLTSYEGGGHAPFVGLKKTTFQI